MNNNKGLLSESTAHRKKTDFSDKTDKSMNEENTTFESNNVSSTKDKNDLIIKK